jgi:hypothetical protein
MPSGTEILRSVPLAAVPLFRKKKDIANSSHKKRIERPLSFVIRFIDLMWRMGGRGSAYAKDFGC